MPRPNIDSLVLRLGFLTLCTMLIVTTTNAAKVPKAVFAEGFGTVT